ncbi:MAG: hypothetical protein LBS24_00645 [Clostridiales Family XIII bacterium]|jgi:hypothetical protein|nr:hypothetical protein [Clostridiales Family XIII bacterium]
MSDIVTAAHICRALETAYTPPEWYLGFEVGNSTGANCRRYADAVAINAYPSKGFETRGFEIKVSKQDLAAELKTGIKSDETAKYCDYWFLVTPKGLSDDFTLPPTWGVIEYHDGKLKQKTRATKPEKTPPTPGFMCAVLRGRERMVASTAGRLTAEREEQIRNEVNQRPRCAEDDLRKLRTKLAEIKESTGISLDVWTPTDPIIARLNAAEALDIITHNVRAVERYANALLKDAMEIQTASAKIKAKEPVDIPDEIERKERRE